jgi:hypothetical protein
LKLKMAGLLGSNRAEAKLDKSALETWGMETPPIRESFWKVGDIGDRWLKDMASGRDATGVCAEEKTGKPEEAFDWEKNVPTVEEASDAVLDGWRCPFDRVEEALGS